MPPLAFLPFSSEALQTREEKKNPYIVYPGRTLDPLDQSHAVKLTQQVIDPDKSLSTRLDSYVKSAANQTTPKANNLPRGKSSVWVEHNTIVLPEDEPWTRQGIIRYTGYANEVGAALKGIIPDKMIGLSNWVSGLYGVVDTAVVSKQEYDRTKGTMPQKEQRIRVAKVAVDAAIFQVFASVWIPYKVVTWMHKQAEKLVEQQVKTGSKLVANMSPVWIKRLPGLISIALVPVIAPPLDRALDWVMNQTVRRWMKMPPTHHRLHFDELHTARYHSKPAAKQTSDPIVFNVKQMN